jgi:uncharacterized protein (TIGR02145 family)
MKGMNRILLCLLFLTGFLFILISGCKKAAPPTTEKSRAEVTDVEGNVYKIVTIGTQVWMAENLKTTKYNNGDAIPTTTSDISGENAPEYQWVYNDTLSNAGIYGRLYTWYVVAGSRNVCPSGWHVPTDAELDTLKSNLGDGAIAGGKLKETGTNHWLTPNTGATDVKGFTALPGGYRAMNGAYSGLTLSCWLWSSTDNAPLGWGQNMYYDNSVLLRGGYHKQAGVSVRCLKD